jgi:hypothetical protein
MKTKQEMMKPEFKFLNHLLARDDYDGKPVYDIDGVLLGFETPDGNFDRALDTIIEKLLIDVSGNQSTLFDDINRQRWIEIYKY